jgi:four helix bundle protein
MQSQEISRQLFRAATSVGANIAEGHGRHKGQEYIHYLTIAQGSANEVDHWLNTVLDCRIASVKDLQDLIRLNNETRKMLTSAINTLQKKQNDKVIREGSSPYSPIPYSPGITEEDL